MENALISIIVPVFNAQADLPSCISQLAAQTEKNYELILVDDCSEDDSYALMQRLAAEDDRIKVLQAPQRGGAGAARNIGIANAVGQYMIFLDADDEYDPALLEKASARLTETGADIVAYNYHQITPDGVVTERKGVVTERINAIDGIFSYRDCPDSIMSNINPTPWNKMYRVDFVREHGLRFEEISSTNDITFASVSVATADKIAVLPDSLYGYKVGGTGTITATKKKTIYNMVIAVTSAYRQVEKLPYFEEIRNSARKFVLDNLIFNIDRHVTDWNAPEAIRYYEAAQEIFRSDWFDPEETPDYLTLRSAGQFWAIRNSSLEDYVAHMATKVAVSVTTFPERINAVTEVIKCLSVQTMMPDAVVLWLAEEQFPNKEADLPAALLEQARSGLVKICWCDDLKPHKKYFYTMQQYPDHAVITVDDDVFYPKDLVERLFWSYMRYPECISTGRARIMTFGKDGKVLPYQLWMMGSPAICGKPSMQLIATGIGGVLYPPHWYDETLFDKEAIMNTCLRADDLWLKVHEVHRGRPVVLAFCIAPGNYVPGTQEFSLYRQNMNRNQNDVQLEQILAWYNGIHGELAFEKKVADTSVGYDFTASEYLAINSLSLLEQDAKSKQAKKKQAEARKRAEAQKKAEAQQKAEAQKKAEASKPVAPAPVKCNPVKRLLKKIVPVSFGRSAFETRLILDQLNKVHAETRQLEQRLGKLDAALTATRKDIGLLKRRSATQAQLVNAQLTALRSGMDAIADRSSAIMQSVDAAGKLTVRSLENFRDTANKRFDTIDKKTTGRLDAIKTTADTIDKKTTGRLDAIRMRVDKIDVNVRQNVWADVFHDSALNSSWLKDKSFNPGRWAIGYQFLYVMYRVLNEVAPSSLLELGLGQSTRMISQYVASRNNVDHCVVEASPEWIELYKEQNPVPAATEIAQLDYTVIDYEGAATRVYEGFDKLVSGKKYDFILIDAPWSGDMTLFSRIDVLRQMPDILADSFVIMFDDTNRENENRTAEKMCQVLTDAGIPFAVGQYQGAKRCTLICSENLKYLTTM